MTNNFTFVWIGDPHLEANHDEAVNQGQQNSKRPYDSSVSWTIDRGQPSNWINQTNWIVKNIPTYNIQAVLCSGDMYMCFNKEPGCRREMEKRVWDWNDKGEGLVAIDLSGLPYLVAVGNHDRDCTGHSHTKTENRITTCFDKYLGHGKICMQPWYEGYCKVEPVSPSDTSCPPSLVEGSKANQAIRFDAGGRHVLVIALEWFPRPEVLRWARNLAKKYHDHEVIIITHAYMTDAGDLFGGYAAHYWGLPKKKRCTGVDILNCAKKLPNVKAILCGHSCGSPTPGGEAHRTDVANDGHPLLGIYSDFQYFNPSSHVVLLLQVSGSEVKVRVFDTNADQEVHYSFDFTTNAEGTSPTTEGTRFDYPYILPWGHWAYRPPSLCCADKKLYMAWKGAPEDDGLWYSSFDGTDWTVWDVILDAKSPNGPALSGDHDVHDDLAALLAAAWNDSGQRLWYSTRPIGEEDFKPPKPILGAASTVGPSLARFKGKLYAAWKGAYTDTNDQRLWYASFDGENWSPQAQMPVGRSSVGPSLAEFKGKLYAAWKGAYTDTNDQRLWYASFDGENWSPQARIPAVAPGHIPLSSVGPSLAEFKGKLYAAWKGEGIGVKLCYASFDGENWSPQARHPTAESGPDYPTLIVPDEHSV
jgi:hypothetical protein